MNNTWHFLSCDSWNSTSHTTSTIILRNFNGSGNSKAHTHNSLVSYLCNFAISELHKQHRTMRFCYLWSSNAFEKHNHRLLFQVNVANSQLRNTTPDNSFLWLYEFKSHKTQLTISSVILEIHSDITNHIHSWICFLGVWMLKPHHTADDLFSVILETQHPITHDWLFCPSFWNFEVP